MLRHALALCAALGTALSASAQSLDTPGAGSAAADSVKSAGDAAATEALARFDLWIAEHPDHASAAAERCRFLSLVAYDSDGVAIRFEAEADACDSELEERHGNAIPARAYLIEQQWGEEAFEKGEAFLLSEGQGTPYELPVLRHLAEVGEVNDESARLLAYYARRAMLLDPSLDLELALDRGLRANGDVPGAIAALMERADVGTDAWLRLQKAALLHELEAHEPSVEQFTRALEDGATPYDRLPYARSLQALGRFDEAREQFRLQAENGYGQWKRDAQRELLALEIAHGDAPRASAAYQGLRDEGFGGRSVRAPPDRAVDRAPIGALANARSARARCSRGRAARGRRAATASAPARPLRGSAALAEEPRRRRGVELVLAAPRMAGPRRAFHRPARGALRVPHRRDPASLVGGGDRAIQVLPGVARPLRHHLDPVQRRRGDRAHRFLGIPEARA